MNHTSENNKKLILGPALGRLVQVWVQTFFRRFYLVGFTSS